MYYEYFGLTQAPFRITPNTDFFFGGGNRGPILEALIYAVTNGEGIIKVSGEVGSGKTMLCNMLMERLPENVETVYLANPSVSPDEILHAIAFELQLAIDRQSTRLEVTQALHAYLLKRHAEGKRVVVFVEESQGMPLATLEEIRLLSNLETRNDKLLQIVLFGQPELDENLRQPNIRQLRERITHSFGLAPLNANDVREYLMFRLRAAGYHGPDLFTDKIVSMITRASGGLTRRVNLIADKAMLAAFSENTHTLKPRHIEAALRDSEFSHVAVQRSSPWRGSWIVAALAGSALGAAGYAWLIQPPQAPPVPVAAPIVPAATAGPAVPATATAGVAPPATVVATEPPVLAAIKPPPAPAAVAPPVVATELPTKPALEPPAEGAATASQPDDVLQSRLIATQQWLVPENDPVWTLQTLSTTSEGDLRNHLTFLTKTIEINKIYVYRKKGAMDQKPVLSVLYGTYGNKAEAERVLAQLPAQLKSNKPWLRTVQSIRADMR